MSSHLLRIDYNFRNFRKLFLLFILFLFAILLVYILLPVHVTYQPGVSWYAGVDWKNSFRPATLAFYSLKTPYIPGTFNPPWAFIPLLPIALLPPDLGAAVIFVLNLFVIGFVSYRLGAKTYVIFAILLSPIALIGSFNANIDWMVVLSLVVPPQLGIFLALVKPQVGGMIALYLACEAWRKGGFWATFRLVIPVLIVILITMKIFAPWPFNMNDVSRYGKDWGIWPAGIPIGIALFVLSLRSHKIGYAAIATPFLSPYIGAPSWIVAILGLLPNTVETLSAVASFWILQIFWKFLPFL